MVVFGRSKERRQHWDSSSVKLIGEALCFKAILAAAANSGYTALAQRYMFKICYRKTPNT